jgi:hypothetical protein
MGRVCERETSTVNHGAVTPMNAMLLMVSMRLLCFGIGLYGLTLGLVTMRLVRSVSRDASRRFA